MLLLERLTEIQRREGYSDTVFARHLGIPRSTWQLTRTGVKRIGRRVALAAMRAYPELTGDVISFLLSDATPATDPATPATCRKEVVA